MCFIFLLQTPTISNNAGTSSTIHFQTPVRGATTSNVDLTNTTTFETPKSTNILKKIDNDEEKNEILSPNKDADADDVEKKEQTKIKFVEQENNTQNYQTPVSFKMNKFIMCFKSEPDLSRVQNVSENGRTLNRGRFIAKKLLGGVSMVNLRRPFVNSTEKGVVAVKMSTETIECIKNSDQVDCQKSIDIDEIHGNDQDIDIEKDKDKSPVNKIEDDDEDFVDDEEVDREYDESVDKENETPETNQEPNANELMVKMKPNTISTNCGIPLLDSTVNDSVSPITKSTHRMSKAMQVK